MKLQVENDRSYTIQDTIEMKARIINMLQT